MTTSGDTKIFGVVLTGRFSGQVTMHKALSLVILLKDETGAPMTTEKALSIVDVDSFKQLIGLTQDKGWELRMATPPLWGGKPVERHLALLSNLEVAVLVTVYSSLYPHNQAGGFAYSDLPDSIKDDEIRKQYDEGKFLALDGTFQPFLNAGEFPVKRGEEGEPVFKMALRAAMTKAVEKLGHPSCIQFVVDDTILLELPTCTFLESLATKALAIGIDEKTKSYCRDFRGAMGLRPDFPKTEYTLEMKVGVGAMWTEVEGKPDNFVPHATLANVGPTTETLGKVDVDDIQGSLLMLAHATLKQRLPKSANQGFVSFGPATQYMKETVMLPATEYLLATHGLNPHSLTYAIKWFPPSYGSVDGNFDKAIKASWEESEGDDETKEWEKQCVGMFQYELQELMPFFINVTSEEDKKMLPATCRLDPRSPIEKLQHHSTLSQEVALMIAKSVVGENFSKACDFWAKNAKGASVETELEKLARTSPKVAAVVEESLKQRRKA